MWKKLQNKKGFTFFEIAQGKPFSRLRGKSDILYIGKTESKAGFRGRLLQYLHPSRKQWMNTRIHELSKKYEIELA